jgi:hypothetical protein
MIMADVSLTAWSCRWGHQDPSTRNILEELQHQQQRCALREPCLAATCTDTLTTVELIAYPLCTTVTWGDKVVRSRVQDVRTPILIRLCVDWCRVIAAKQQTSGNVQCAMRNVQCVTRNVRCAVYNAQYVMRNLQCAVCNAQCAMCSVQCAMCNV